ncbi:nickel-dependent lactate racemase [Wukongibacter baidiensis]|uniref:nickel-dependent lactate racemase n=1 Tax=Wukongibacter baidiensis TaxID=1723361 RepID=UPI003D7F1C7A
MPKNMRIITVPYGEEKLEAKIPNELFLFEGKMESFDPLLDFNKTLIERLDRPSGCEALKNQVSAKDRVLILIEDNTRITPVNKILPILIDYLENAGVRKENIEILTAPGTHRVMTEEEIIEKVGMEIYETIKIHQHDYTDKDSIVDLGEIRVGDMIFPVHVNKKVLEFDYMIGLGNIIPHSDAGFSGGAKIVQPGICGSATTSATHIAGALMKEIPLGNIDNNPCRQGIEEVAGKVGLRFIINVVMTPEREVVDIFTGDFVKAHREGSKLSGKVYGVQIPSLADVVVVSSSPCDIDYWQAEKGLVSAYFSVKEGGYIIFVAPCYEGMEHNHPRLRHWCKYTYEQAKKAVKNIPLEDEKADLVAADIAMANSRVRERANILIVTDGLSDDDIKVLEYERFKTLQEAVDYALAKTSNGKVGVLPRGGDCLPYLE